jgi:hypothetical protein
MPSIEAEGFAVRCPPLERDGGWPEGYRVRQFDGPLRLFGPWPLLLRVIAVRGVICGGVFDRLLGDPMAVPDKRKIQP